ncbi:Conserved_hypothetical protein [Hexamita inflata]|uniref:Uncharacterized protein n=1 Tax=Hexamita inflata TaxID=28002 RepID=A0AA86PXN5_9EUKA|nr:Conserved hypothetical protein [Hexamita inflata]
MRPALKIVRRKDDLGGLGPDLECDAYKAAAEKARIQKEFAEKARLQFMQQSKFESKEKLTEIKQENAEKIAAKEKMDKAKNYAKSIQKPKVIVSKPLDEYIPPPPKAEPVKEETFTDKILNQLEEHDKLLALVKEYY